MVDVFIWVTLIVSAKLREDSGCYSNVLWMPYSWVHLSMSYNYFPARKQKAGSSSEVSYWLYFKHKEISRIGSLHHNSGWHPRAAWEMVE